jgi:hypothetical protein
MLVKALEYEGFVEDPDWVYRWNDREWGAKGISSFYRPGKIVSPSRLIMDHILDRLGIEPGLRHAWCESHADDVIEQEFLGEWPGSTPEEFRTKRVFRGTVATMWDHGLYRTFREQVGDFAGGESGA